MECTFCDPHLSSSSPTLTLSPLLARNRYDTSVFNSSKQCCACGGGEHNLLIDANVSNSEGYTCSDIAVFRSYGYEDLCTSAYDTPDFAASEMCLVCGGGQLMEDSWYETPEVQEVQEYHEVVGCDDSMWDGRVDVDRDGCDEYTSNPGWCGGYDDSDFTSNEMCCACGGGEDQHELIPYIPYQPAKICVDTNHDQVNSDGYSCSYINQLHDNENIAYDCDTQADTSTFSASSMCCACGGGINWNATSSSNHIEMRCLDKMSSYVDSRGLTCDSYHDGTSGCGSHDTPHFNSSSLCCDCGGGESFQFRDFDILNSKGFSCYDIARLMLYGFDEVCTSAFDTSEFIAFEMCLVCGGGNTECVWNKASVKKSLQNF